MTRGAFHPAAIALDAGFASKSTFNDVFERHRNLTPSSYRSSLEPLKAQS